LPNCENLRGLNKGQAGLWKIENIDIAEVVALKSKQYSFLCYKEDPNSGEVSYVTQKKCKGIPKKNLNLATHDMYKNVVLSDSQKINLNVNLIRSLNHRLFCITVDKMAFHNLDVTRYYPSTHDVNLSYPFGYYKLITEDNEHNLAEDTQCKEVNLYKKLKLKL